MFSIVYATACRWQYSRQWPNFHLSEASGFKSKSRQDWKDGSNQKRNCCYSILTLHLFTFFLGNKLNRHLLDANIYTHPFVYQRIQIIQKNYKLLNINVLRLNKIYFNLKIISHFIHSSISISYLRFNIILDIYSSCLRYGKQIK